MKIKFFKLPLLVSLVLFSANVYGEDLRPPHRLFEIGVDSQADLSNNVISLSKLMSGNISSSSFGSKMASLNFDLGTNAFINLNLPNGFRFGLRSGVELDGYYSFGTSILDLLKSGATATSGNVSGSTSTDAFLHTDFTISFPIKKKMRFSITPSLVTPVMHIGFEDINLGASVNNNNILHITARGSANIYTSGFDVGSVVNGGTSTTMVDINFNELLRSSGFDLSAAFEMPLHGHDELQLGGYARIPIVPGKLLHGTTADLNFQTDIDMNNYFEEEAMGLVSSIASDLSQYVKTGAQKYRLSRPLKLGAEMAYRPFGDWFTFYGLIGMGIRYPYTKYAKIYPEYNVGLSLLGWNTIGISVSSGYLNRVFIHEVGFVLNARVLELNFAVSAQSSNFVKSLQGAGFGAKLYVALGVPQFKKSK